MHVRGVVVALRFLVLGYSLCDTAREWVTMTGSKFFEVLTRIGIALFVTTGVLAVAVTLMWAARELGQLYSGGEAGATVLAAMIGLVGVLVTAAVTVSGVLIQRAMARRSHLLAKEAESRLVLEAGMKAADLMTSARGKTTKYANAAALTLLADLRQLDIVIGAVGPMWEEELLDTEAAVELLDRALTDPSSATQNQGAIILLNNAKRLAERELLHWPASLLAVWPKKAPTNARCFLVEAVVRAVLALERTKWELSSLNRATGILYLIVKTDDHAAVKLTAASFLQILLKLYGGKEDSAVFTFEYGEVKLGEIRRLASQVISQLKGEPFRGSDFKTLSPMLEQWVNS